MKRRTTPKISRGSAVDWVKRGGTLKSWFDEGCGKTVNEITKNRCVQDKDHTGDCYPYC